MTVNYFESTRSVITKFNTVEPLITDTSNKERKSYSPNRLHKLLDELQLTYTSYNGHNLNSPAVSVIRGSTVVRFYMHCISFVVEKYEYLIKNVSIVTSSVYYTTG
jgi:hypothetical protein